MTVDVARLSARELNSLIKSAQKRKAQLDRRPPASKVRAVMVKYARDAGYRIDELFGEAASGPKAAGKKRAAAPARRKGKLPPKYRNPANPEETWTGRGSQPRWLSALTAKGKKLERFLIKP